MQFPKTVSRASGTHTFHSLWDVPRDTPQGCLGPPSPPPLWGVWRRSPSPSPSLHLRKVSSSFWRALQLEEELLRERDKICTTKTHTNINIFAHILPLSKQFPGLSSIDQGGGRQQIREGGEQILQIGTTITTCFQWSGFNWWVKVW